MTDETQHPRPATQPSPDPRPPSREVGPRADEPLEDRSLTVYSPSPGSDLDEMKRLGIIMVEAGYFTDAKAGSPKQEVARAIVKLMAGRELGLSPIASMRGVYMLPDGGIGYSSNLIASAIKKSGRYDYRVLENSATRCVIAFFEGGEKVGESAWSLEDAQRAGLASKNNWKNYPAAMLFSRALASGSRMFAPDLFDGPAYTVDEINDGAGPPRLEVLNVDPATGEVIDG
jgi:hypothetical protein